MIDLKHCCLLVAATAVMTACGGGSGVGVQTKGGIEISIESLGFEPKYFGTDGTGFADYQGQSVRVLLSSGEYGSGTLTRAKGLIGSVTFLDDGSGGFVFNHPDTSPWTLYPSGTPGEYEYIPSGSSSLPKYATLLQNGDVSILLFDIDGGIQYGQVFAAFGFETPIVDRPVSEVSYTGAGFLQVSDNISNTFSVTGTSALDVNFDSGIVSGILLDVDDPAFDLDGDGLFDDRLLMTLTLENGTTGLYGLNGQVSAVGSAFIGISPDAEDMNVNVTASGAEGAFYGPSAESMAIVYDGDVSITVPGSTAVDYEFGGVTVAQQ